MLDGFLATEVTVKEFEGGGRCAEARLPVTFKAYTKEQKERANDKGYVTEWFTLKSATEEGFTALTKYAKGNLVQIVNPNFSTEKWTKQDGTTETKLVLTVFRDSDIQLKNSNGNTVQAPSKEAAMAGTSVKGPWGKKAE